MIMKKTEFENVDQYIGQFSPEIRAVLQEIRDEILTVVPSAEEIIRYGIPTYVLNGNFVHFGAFSKHISLYPAPKRDSTLVQKIAPFLSGQSTLKFPIGKPLPIALIRQIVQSLAKENMKKVSGNKR